MKDKILYDSYRNIYYLITKRNNKKQVIALEAPSIGRTCSRFLFKSNNLCSVLNRFDKRFTTVLDQITPNKKTNKCLLPPLNYYKNQFDLCLSNKCEQRRSNQCIQRRRSFRNYLNSQKEIKKNKNLNKKNIKCQTYHNNFPREKYVLVKKLENGNKIFKRFCFITGAWRCSGNLTVPKNMTIGQYLERKIRFVKRCEINYFDQEGNPIYFNYKFINGMWQFINQSKKCEN